MKQGIHPSYEEKAVITCSCGAIFEAGSSKGDMIIEICSQCHPFYTGKKKVIDSTGRVDRFKKMTEKTSARKEKQTKLKMEKKESKDKKSTPKKPSAKKSASKTKDE